MNNPLAGGHAGESPYRYDPAARLSLTMGYSRDPLHDSRYPWWLPPRDRCAWSPEIARKRTREMVSGDCPRQRTGQPSDP